MDNMQRLESQISMYHTIFMICIVLFVLFLLVDIFLFIKLDIRKVIGFLTGKTARKTIEEMKAGGFGESARLSGKVSGTKKKKKAKSVALYLLGSAAVTVGMAAVMPKVMGKVGQKIYTESLKKQGDDDWTQEILNRRQAEAEAEEEKKNG